METFVLVVCILYTISAVFNVIKASVLQEPSLLLQSVIDSGIAIWGWNIILNLY